ncbi:MAG TPA: hypothetical protein RMH99_15785 [Sandaracinaceae bacterium LLY-WYZ-13_1]|nr:hypothetical protein [Sandaracinaceae bacterium LLY-WYZ-13_1]
MGEEQHGRSDTLVYLLALGVALIAGGAAVFTSLGGEDAPDDAAPRATAEARGASEERAGGPDGERGDSDDPTSSPGADYVPDLPSVPDLESEPPPERELDDRDPRFAELGAEMRVLSRARRLLEEHPAEALGVLEQHRRRHPNGALREEREAFAIEALMALDRVAEAERRYYDFRDDFPRSDFDARLDELMRAPGR